MDVHETLTFHQSKIEEADGLFKCAFHRPPLSNNFQILHQTDNKKFTIISKVKKPKSLDENLVHTRISKLVNRILNRMTGKH